MVRRAVGLVVVAVAAAWFLGCSDGGPSAEAIAKAEELALAALLTEGDLPAADWAVGESGFAEVIGGPAAAAKRAEAMPEECGTGADFPDATQSFNGMLTVRSRSFVSDRTASAQELVAFRLTVMVFESAEQVQELIGAPASEVESMTESRACLDARAAAMGAQGYDVRIEAIRYELPDDHAFRRTIIITWTTYAGEFPMEINTFARGRVVASYMILDAGGPLDVDHQALLEAFEARVVPAQE